MINKPREHSRSERQAAARLRSFGIDAVRYAEMVIAQEGLCAICHQPETSRARGGGIRTLCVDHDHTTGQVRGLLCQRCNSALGLLDEDMLIMASMIAYVNR